MDTNDTAPVCVTGANGYVGSWVTKALLDRGLTVHATVRDPNNARKFAHLQKSADASEGTLRVFRGDLLEPGSFDAALEGCSVLFHTASPFFISGIKDAKKQLVDPALEGTKGALESATRAGSVKRVVLTSSVAAIYGDNADMADRGLSQFTEEHWNESSSLSHQPYSYSKTLAEREAWRLAKDAQWQLVAINPAVILGPSVDPQASSTSIRTMRDMIDGTSAAGVADLTFGLVDVRDVADAHLDAAFQPNVEGRFITVSGCHSMLEIAELLRDEFGTSLALAKRVLPKWLVWLVAPTRGVPRGFISRNVGYRLDFDTGRLRDTLGITP
ncbi:MAG: NAD-dependent epimerase/dehydratase family protein, partial [Myxococcota bacterium]